MIRSLRREPVLEIGARTAETKGQPDCRPYAAAAETEQEDDMFSLAKLLKPALGLLAGLP